MSSSCAVRLVAAVAHARAAHAHVVRAAALRPVRVVRAAGLVLVAAALAHVVDHDGVVVVADVVLAGRVVGLAAEAAHAVVVNCEVVSCTEGPTVVDRRARVAVLDATLLALRLVGLVGVREAPKVVGLAAGGAALATWRTALAPVLAARRHADAHAVHVGDFVAAAAARRVLVVCTRTRGLRHTLVSQY